MAHKNFFKQNFVIMFHLIMGFLSQYAKFYPCFFGVILNGFLLLFSGHRCYNEYIKLPDYGQL